MTDLSDTTATVTAECDLCDFVATGPDTGKGSARFKLGTHKYREHGVRSSKAKANKSAAGKVTDDDIAARPVLAVVRDVADQVGGQGAPNADQLTAGLGRGLGLVTVAVAAFAVESDPTIPEGPAGDALRTQWVGQLSLSEKAARDTMRPIGKALAPTKLNKRYGRQVVDNVDVLGSIAELATLTLNWRRYFRTRAGATAPVAAPWIGAPFPEEQAAAMPEPAETVMTTPAPSEGVVVTPSMIQAARQARGM